MRKVHLIDERPFKAPEGWLVCNAPRPLPGTKTWTGRFVCGCYYAAIDPDDEFAEMLTENCRKLDAAELVWHTFEEAKAMVKERYPKYADAFDKLPEDHVRQMFLTTFNRV